MEKTIEEYFYFNQNTLATAVARVNKRTGKITVNYGSGEAFPCKSLKRLGLFGFKLIGRV